MKDDFSKDEQQAIISVRDKLETRVSLIGGVLSFFRKGKKTANADRVNDKIRPNKTALKFMIEGSDIPDRVNAKIEDIIAKSELKPEESGCVEMLVFSQPIIEDEHKKALKISDADFDLLFPKIPVNFDYKKNAEDCLLALMATERRMIFYCDRILC